MGWQRSSRYGLATIRRLLKIIGLFCKEPYKRDYILQKRPMLLRSLKIVTTPLALSIGILRYQVFNEYGPCVCRNTYTKRSDIFSSLLNVAAFW